MATSGATAEVVDGVKMSPQVLAANNVPVYRAVHEAGTFMITTPGAYHTGFNTGFNVAESTNFAFADWLPVGARALSRYRTPPTRDTTVLHDALIVTAAQHALPRELPPLLDELRDMLRNETDALRSLAEAGVMMPPAAAKFYRPDADLNAGGGSMGMMMNMMMYAMMFAPMARM